MIRETSVRGQFYPASCQEIDEMIEGFNTLLDEHVEDKVLFETQARMIIVPHAGYVYSGFTANVAHRILAASNAQRVLVIGPSHRIYVQGASIALHERYVSPCGDIEMDKSFAQELKTKHGLIFEEDAHFEHSTETQIPFIKHYLPNAKVAEIVYGDIDYERLSVVIKESLADPQSVVVISTDLSHFYSLDEANRLDNICLEAISELDNQKMQEGSCEACGKTGVMAALDAAKKLNLKVKLLDYRTSADVTKDRDSVVGYMSALFF